MEVKRAQNCNSDARFREIDLSDLIWGDNYDVPLLEFVIVQSSPELVELNLNGCTSLTDEILEKWLAKCGPSIKIMGICSNLLSLTFQT